MWLRKYELMKYCRLTNRKGNVRWKRLKHRLYTKLDARALEGLVLDRDSLHRLDLSSVHVWEVPRHITPTSKQFVRRTLAVKMWSREWDLTRSFVTKPQNSKSKWEFLRLERTGRERWARNLSLALSHKIRIKHQTGKFSFNPYILFQNLARDSVRLERHLTSIEINVSTKVKYIKRKTHKEVN